MATALVKGMPVVSLADGTRLGTIDHVYFDPRRRVVVGFTFHQGGGLFGGGSSGLVDISDVHAFGPDAVTVNDISVVRSELAVETNQTPLLDLESLLDRTVMTEGGALVGRVAAIRFGDASHSLVALDVVGESSTRGRIGAREIQTIGPELIIVADPARAMPRPIADRARLRALQIAPLPRGDAHRWGRVEPLTA